MPPCPELLPEIQQVVSLKGDILILMSLSDFERLSSTAGPSASAKHEGGSDSSGEKFPRMPALVRNAIDEGEAPLLAWRRYRQISQTRLAEMSGISRHTILRIERDGVGAGNRRSRLKLAAALGIGVGAL